MQIWTFANNMQSNHVHYVAINNLYKHHLWFIYIILQIHLISQTPLVHLQRTLDSPHSSYRMGEIGREERWIQTDWVDLTSLRNEHCHLQKLIAFSKGQRRRITEETKLKPTHQGRLSWLISQKIQKHQFQKLVDSSKGQTRWFTEEIPYRQA